MSAFKDRIKNYNAQKETKVNPPEAKTVLETKSEPEVENVKTPPVSEEKAPSEPSGAAPAAAAEFLVTASAEPPKAKRGRPAGSKNSAKQPEPAPTTEATSAVVLQGAVDPNSDIDDLCAALTARGFEVTLRFTGRKVGE